MPRIIPIKINVVKRLLIEVGSRMDSDACDRITILIEWPDETQPGAMLTTAAQKRERVVRRLLCARGVQTAQGFAAGLHGADGIIFVRPAIARPQDLGLGPRLR
jgi:hypothetical protein